MLYVYDTLFIHANRQTWSNIARKLLVLAKGSGNWALYEWC